MPGSSREKGIASERATAQSRKQAQKNIIKPPTTRNRYLSDRRSTCLLLLAVQRRRVESLVLGALSSSPVHRALVLVLGTNIAVLLDCPSRLDSVAFLPYLLTYLSDQVIRENPASRGTETSAEELVGPPWRMVSNAGQQQWCGGYPCTLDGGPMGHSARSTVPPPHPPLQSASEGIGGARGLGNSVRPESHPEPRGFPVRPDARF